MDSFSPLLLVMNVFVLHRAATYILDGSDFPDGMRSINLMKVYSLYNYIPDLSSALYKSRSR